MKNQCQITINYQTSHDIQKPKLELKLQRHCHCLIQTFKELIKNKIKSKRYHLVE